MKPPQWLIALGVPEMCISQNSSAKEHARRFSIRPQPGDSVWRIKTDGCWINNEDVRRVDYIFWVKSATSTKGIVLLVELKGKHVGDALDQVSQTLERLCKQSDHRGIHTGAHHQSPGHDLVAGQGIRAYVVLSRGRGVRQRLKENEAIRRKYGVRVIFHEQQLFVDGIENLP